MIVDHKLAEAHHVSSPNCGGWIDPSFIVMHYTGGWNAAGAVRTFQSKSSKVSAHLTIDMDGTIYQHVPFNTKAWHAGPSRYAGYSGLNSHSIGIEFVNPGYLKMRTDGKLVDWAGNVKTPRQIGPMFEARHKVVGSGVYYWPEYPAAQLRAADAVVADLIENYKILDIVTHEEIDTRGWKSDPGPAFPMNRYCKMLRSRATTVEYFEVTASSLNMRSGPGTGFGVIAALPRGARVEEIDVDGPWTRVTQDGWVHSKYLRRAA